MLTLGRERVGEFKHRASICGQILEVINKLMNFFLNHALISLNTPQNIFLTIIEKYILIIWNISWKSSSNSPSVQVLRQQIRGGGGSRLVLILLTQGGVGGPKSGKSCWRNTWMLPYGCFMIFSCIFIHISWEIRGSIMVISCVFHGWFMDVSYYFIVVL